jgi:ubiquinone/menaquinone biosynthesis C-methylase UbiE
MPAFLGLGGIAATLPLMLDATRWRPLVLRQLATVLLLALTGCGTGSLVVLVRQLFPDAEVVGLDPDEKALARATRKAQRAATNIQFDRGFSDALEYRDASFDRVFCSFMFHHLQRDEKERTLRAIARVLKADGSLHLLDFGGPDSSGHRSRHDLQRFR